ncbi:hypothetical protein PGT21_019707 [Puccinia graminis f. sp. tritici]|uniref:Uncharacterized protein n=1 Tax=Puccinia graminis f. sp. tritici TaxID=56615 RepID=A0A5B0PDT5_PUCGR|nr:hypothetical protein PGTUg99_030762 [Puccinia graminis f. sp. tritici]KAA1099765.1 hypothetical protein PGT21_019707 [Puccinia graminis f. sp. tritici]
MSTRAKQATTRQQLHSTLLCKTISGAGIQTIDIGLRPQEDVSPARRASSFGSRIWPIHRAGMASNSSSTKDASCSSSTEFVVVLECLQAEVPPLHAGGGASRRAQPIAIDTRLQSHWGYKTTCAFSVRIFQPRKAGLKNPAPICGKVDDVQCTTGQKAISPSLSLHSKKKSIPFAGRLEQPTWGWMFCCSTLSWVSRMVVA